MTAAPFWDAHAAQRLAHGPPQPLQPPARLEWTQRPGIGPAADLLGDNLTGLRILELGCGAGHNTAHLAAVGALAIGVDRSTGQIERANAHYGHTGALFTQAPAVGYLRRGIGHLDAIFSVFGAIGTSEPSRLLGACSRRLGRHGVLAFSVPHPRRTGVIPLRPRHREAAALPDGTSGSVDRFDVAPASWACYLNRAGLLVTGLHDHFAPVDAQWPTTLLVTARKP
ncbi:methyltransferase domain-containing protein [Kitasatospora sp. NPDC093806]|uniref:class I SAM-dependent methyltransferase n=1 Tax=Kitasatospora sp. NPDC093806 TaxID=3155075 RepID=UPI00344637F2